MMHSRALAAVAAMSLIVHGAAQASDASNGAYTAAGAEMKQGSSAGEDDDTALDYALWAIGVIVLVVVLIEVALDDFTEEFPPRTSP
jgi:hypothetical protein